MPDSKTEEWRGKSWGLPAWYAPIFCALVVAVFCLIALGGSVRAMNAGLACPDWPLCFGALIPDFHPQVYFEFIHRVVAGTISIVTLGLMIFLFRSQAPKRMKILGGGVLALLLTQIVFGGLTVLLQLQANVVATHLALGTGYFALLLWMYLGLNATKETRPQIGPSWLYPLTAFMTLIVYLQVILGGLVASNFASLACTEFPTCLNGQWIPTWHGIVGLHLVHRFNAYFVCFMALLSGFLIFKKSLSPRLKKLALYLVIAILCQIGLGAANVLFYVPPLITVLHLATATLILSIAIRELHLTSRA